MDTRRYLANFKVLVTVLPIDNKIIELSLASDFPDFENSLQYITALEHNIDILITRNKKDFKNAQIPVLSGAEFLSK